MCSAESWIMWKIIFEISAWMIYSMNVQISPEKNMSSISVMSRASLSNCIQVKRWNVTLITHPRHNSNGQDGARLWDGVSHPCLLFHGFVKTRVLIIYHMQCILRIVRKFSSDDVLVCRRFGLSTFWFVDVSVCRCFGLSTFWFVRRRFGLSMFRSVDVWVCRRFGLSTFWFVDV